MTDRGLSEVYALDGVITTVDALTGLQTLERHGRGVRQAAVADRLVLTKTDLPGAQTAATARAACGCQSGRDGCWKSSAARSRPAALFDCGFYDAAAKHPGRGVWLAVEARSGRGRTRAPSSRG